MFRWRSGSDGLGEAFRRGWQSRAKCAEPWTFGTTVRRTDIRLEKNFGNFLLGHLDNEACVSLSQSMGSATLPFSGNWTDAASNQLMCTS
jgi:hypothetical protein